MSDRSQRIEALYHAARERAPADQAAFLEGACTGDVALQREVESLLAQRAGSEFFKTIAGDRPALASGARIGAYAILAPLGTGSMGEVYRARDTKLGRDVAIKVLPASLADDPDRRARFEREARVLAALNHPHIAQIYGIEESDGVLALVMELVPGETLAQMIQTARGRRLSVGDALRFARQIVDALDAAHEKGIVHRDLKPANTKVTPDGTVKVLDFGLAKATLGGATGGDPLELPTVTADGTRPGVIVGTVAYMSPEQARGQSVDKRTDIWALGCVLYEMLTGRRAFAAETMSDTIVAIIEREPDWSALPASTPASVRQLLRRCLAKDPKRRLHDIADARFELEESDGPSAAAGAITGDTTADLPVVGDFDRQRSLRRRRLLVAGLVIAASIGGAWWLSRRVGNTFAVPRVIPLTTSPSGRASFASFSADGKEVAFAWNGEKEEDFEHIYVQLIGSETPVRLTSAAANDTSPAWSPDGSRIAFLRREHERDVLYVVSRLGGSETRVGDFEPATRANSSLTRGVVFTNPGLSWSADARWLVVAGQRQGADKGVVLTSVDGGVRRLLLPSSGSGHYESPIFSPSGHALAFADCTGSSELFCRVNVVDLNPTTLVPTGPARRLTTEFEVIGGIAWSEDERSLIYGAASVWLNTFHLWRVPVSGDQTPERVEVAGPATLPSISKVAHRLAFSHRDFDLNIWQVHDGGAPEPIVPSIFSDYDASFSRDGEKIAFVTDRRGDGSEVWTANRDGTQPTSLTKGTQRTLGSPRWSPGDRFLAFDGKGEDGRWHVSVIDARGGQPRRLTSGVFSENIPSWSSDGAWVYFASNRGGDRVDVWRVRISDGEVRQVTHAGGEAPLESTDGKVLYYIRNGKLFAMNLPEGPEQQVLSSVLGWDYWPVQDGIYYVPVPEQGPRRGPIELTFLNFRTGRSERRSALPFEYFHGGLAVSPDGKTVLVSGVARIGVNLMLIENFR